MSSAENPLSTSAQDARDQGLPPGMPSETVRGVVSLALFVHLFIAVVAILGAMRGVSQMVARLDEKFVTQLAYPDYFLLSSFAYQLTYALDLEYDGAAEVVLDWTAEDEAQPSRVAEKQTLAVFDPAEIKLPIRRQRYLSLIRTMGNIASNPQLSSREVDMPLAVSKAVLADAGNPNGAHRFRLLRIPTPPPAYSEQPAMPPAPPVYQGNITVRDGRFGEFTKADRASLVAPPVRGRGAAPAANPGDGDASFGPRTGASADPTLPFDPTLPSRPSQPLDFPVRPDVNE